MFRHRSQRPQRTRSSEMTSARSAQDLPGTGALGSRSPFKILPSERMTHSVAAQPLTNGNVYVTIGR